MDMSQYLGLFFSETREHINNLNKLVVNLEQEPGHRDTINSLFREAHSIKGMAATMGFENTARLAHRLEDLLDGFRTSGEVPAAVFDYLLTGIDLLDGLLDDLQESQPERSIASFLDQSPGDTPSPAADTIGNGQSAQLPGHEEPAGPGPAETRSADQDQGRADPDRHSPADETDTFQVMVGLEEETPAPAARCLMILRELNKAGEVITSQPDLDSLRSGEPSQKLQAWIRTSLTKEHLEEALRKISGVATVRFINDRRRRERSASDEAGQTIRVRTELLDQFVNLAGELITRRNMLLSASRKGDWEELNQALTETGGLIDNLHHSVIQSRLMPLENITGRLPRIVRELSRKTNKKVTLQLEGVEIGIDRVVLEELTDPLVHLVRNALDHGVAQEGIVTVSARRERDLALIEVADNGKGMDPGQLRRRAVERGLLTADRSEALSDQEALMLVCQPGFSTAEEVTETSGRGVGMDVVKAAVDKLGGTLSIISSAGQGTRFQMRLPLSIAIIKVLLVKCGRHPVALPITRIERMLELAPADIRQSSGRCVFSLDGETLPLYSLAEALDLPESPAGATVRVVLTEVQGRAVGLQVDQFIGHRDAFVKKIGYPLNLLSGLSGATIEGDGQVVFIVDPHALLEKRQLFSSDSSPGGADAFS